MPQIKMTDEWVRSVPIPKWGRVEWSDTEVVGLVLRVSNTGRKVWAVSCRGSKGSSTRITIGSYPELSLEKAGSLHMTRAKE